MIALTRFTSLKPGRLSKRFTLAGDTLVKESGGQMTEGVAERLTVPGLGDFATLLNRLTPSQALSYGINGHERARVVAAEARPTAPPGDLPIIARTRDHFTWPDGPGLLMLDYDPAPNGPALAGEALRAALIEACPAVAAAPAVWRPSASSCIHRKSDGAELRGVGGQRNIYVSPTPPTSPAPDKPCSTGCGWPVMDATSFPRAARCWREP